MTLSSSPSAHPIPSSSYEKLPSGVVYADIRKSQTPGPPAKLGSRVNVQ